MLLKNIPKYGNLKSNNKLKIANKLVFCKRYLSYYGNLNSSAKPILTNSPFQLILDDNKAVANVLNSGVKNIRYHC